MITLYAHVKRTSPNTLKLRAALAEADAHYEYRAVDLDAGAQKSSAFLALNPHGKIPVLVEGEFKLAESDAILWYIGERFPEAQLLPVAGGAGHTAIQARARVLQWCSFSSTSMYQAYLDLRIHGAPAPTPAPTPAPAPAPMPASTSRAPSGEGRLRPSRDERINWIGDAAAAKMDRLMGVLDGVLARREFLAGDFSVADLAAAAVLLAVKTRIPRDPTAGRDAIAAWYERVTARPAWQRALAETP